MNIITKILPLIFISIINLTYGQNNSTKSHIRLSALKGSVNNTKNDANFIKSNHSYAENSALQSGTWIKVKLDKNGVYKLTNEELANIGISNPASVKVFGWGGGMLPEMNNDANYDDLVENTVMIDNDALYFYAQGPTEWRYDSYKKMFIQREHDYSNYTYFFLTSDYNSGFDNKIKQADNITETPDILVNSFIDYRYLEHSLDDITPDTNLLNSGKRWFFDPFNLTTSRDYNFDIPDIIAGKDIRANLLLIARASKDSKFRVFCNGSDKTMKFSWVNVTEDTAVKADEADSVFVFPNPAGNSNISIQLNYQKSTSTATGFVDYITVNAWRKLKMNGSQLEFRYVPEDDESGKIIEMTLETVNSATLVWETTDPQNVKSMPTVFSGNSLKFKFKNNNNIRSFIAFDKNTGLLSPISKDDDNKDVGIVENQNLHGISQQDFIIVSPQIFLKKANELADFHRNIDNLKTLVVTPTEIYNEFSSGTPDAAAIRNFMRMLYHRAGDNENDKPKYLLLFGDGSYDNKTISDENNNLIPTYQTEESLSPTRSATSDDFFGLLDAGEGAIDGLVDIGIGRFPVSTVEQAEGVLNKIYTYVDTENMGDWRNTICFIGDDEDSNQHMEHAEALSSVLNDKYPSFNIEKIYLDAYQQYSTSNGERYPDVNRAINQMIEKGALIVNYTGHGSEEQLTHEEVITLYDIDSWRNLKKLPVFMTATCEFSRFDYEGTSAGEHIFLNPKGGAVAMFTTTRLVFSAENQALNKSFYKCVFNSRQNGERYKLGDIMRLTKNYAGDNDNKRNFTLFGDPAMSLLYPKYNIKSTYINDTPVESFTDTLKALSVATIKGYVCDKEGNIINDFNGTVYPSVFDKSDTISTLANNGGNPMDFTIQNSILYKGKATVTNGEFSFSFIVPKDISYKTGFGRISYYAENKEEDAHGSFSQVLIGGTSTSQQTDETGPVIELFMNDEDFKNGDMTNQSPKLLALVSDDSGINTSGTGIGHDITAILDSESKNAMILNDFYEAEVDNYKRGRVLYPLFDLEPGKHTLRFKVWDIHNNSSESEIGFIVEDANKLKIENLINYPNPVRDKTNIKFNHNRPDTDLTVELKIFSLSGQLIDAIETEMNTFGFSSEPIEWQAKSNLGSVLERGVYIYKVKVTTEEGFVAEESAKLVVLK